MQISIKRCLELKKNDYSIYSDEKTLKKLFDVLHPKLLLIKAHAFYIFDLSLNEKNETFHKLIAMLRDEFTFGDKGLNNYLSTRIRHGVLPNTIREPVSKEKLVTAINANTKLPKKNEYWRKVLLNLAEDEWLQIEKALITFTKDYENILSEINDKWLQIVSLDQDIQNMQGEKVKKEALFNYSISSFETYYLQRILNEESYEEFIQGVTKWLWSRTEVNLESVKKGISTTIKNKFVDIYSTLSASINLAVSDKEQIVSLNDAIGRSKGQTYTALNVVSSWFTISEADAIKEFEIVTAIEIAARSVNVKVDHNIPEGVALFKGKYLTSLVDVLYILFENAVTKSNVQKDDLDIKVSFKLDADKRIILAVSNKCKINTNIGIANQQIDCYRKECGDENSLREVVQKEGGTGIIKIKKILTKDLEVKYDMNFEYCPDNIFFMKITMYEPKGVLYDKNIVS